VDVTDGKISINVSKLLSDVRENLLYCYLNRVVLLPGINHYYCSNQLVHELGPTIFELAAGFFADSYRSTSLFFISTCFQL